MYNIYNVIFDKWLVICIPARTLEEAQAKAELSYPGQTFQVELEQPRKVIRTPYSRNELKAQARVSRGRADPNWLP